MMTVAVFIVGAPGCGKTTLVRALIDLRWATYSNNPKWTVSGRTAAAGHYVGGLFDGADTVPYNGAAKAVEYWRARVAPFVDLTIFDGDRFSDEKSKLAIAAGASRCFCVHLICSDAALAERRVKRGSAQNETWAKGRATKADRFASRFDDNDVLIVDADATEDEVARQVRAFLPSGSSLTGGER